jgi:hypothetical protein
MKSEGDLARVDRRRLLDRVKKTPAAGLALVGQFEN